MRGITKTASDEEIARCKAMNDRCHPGWKMGIDFNIVVEPFIAAAESLEKMVEAMYKTKGRGLGQ